MRTIQHLRTVARLAYLCAAFLALSAFERRYWRFRAGCRSRGPDSDGLPNLDEAAQRAEMRARCVEWQEMKARRGR